MDNKVEAEIKRTRHVSMFDQLRSANHVLLDNAKSERDGYLYEYLSCLVMSAFSFEALVNDVGHRAIPAWDDLETLTWKRKLRVLAINVDLKIDFSKRPLQTVNTLFAVRNQVAHGRPHALGPVTKREQGTHEELRRRHLTLKWEEQANADFAQRAVKDVDEFADQLYVAAKIDRKRIPRDLRSYDFETFPIPVAIKAPENSSPRARHQENDGF